MAKVRQKGGLPVIVTPVERRRWSREGKPEPTLAEFAEAARRAGKEENVPVIDLNAMSLKLYEALGPEGSKKAFVFHAANTFPGREKALADDSHFSNYGAYELARSVVEGIKGNVPALAKLLADDVKPYDPARPDPIERFGVPASPPAASEKPEGSRRDRAIPRWWKEKQAMKKTRGRRRILALAAAAAGMVWFSSAAHAVAAAGGPRRMENLGRGVVVVRTNKTDVFISWRLLGLDPAGIRFNVYRSAGGGKPVKLNGAPLSGGCNFTDSAADLSRPNAYHVRPVVRNVEQAASAAYALPANAAAEPLLRIPLRPAPGRSPFQVWVGDADGDGEYEFFVSLTATATGRTQKLQAYKRDGTFLWEADFGPNSVNPSGLYPNAAAIAAGQWDGVTVYDLDSDGRAEVVVKSADGVTFGDGKTLKHGDNLTQFISVLDGRTGAERARTVLPNPWKNANNRALGTLFGVGYCDGVRPSLLIHAKSRVGGAGTPFNLIQSAWDFRDGSLRPRWSVQWDGNAPDAPVTSHQIRIVDVDGDGKDDLVPGMHVIGSDGKLLYNLRDQGIVHGDRFHITDLDPARPGLEGYGIQQNNASGLVEYFYDPKTGKSLWTVNIGSTKDAARGVAADVDPRHPGFEVWSFYGMRTATGTKIADEPTRPWPNFQIWWDGDVLGECLNETKVEKWDYSGRKTSRLLTASDYGASHETRGAPLFYGDILGDWREEIVYQKADGTELQVFTTTSPTRVRLYTLAHNPAYRNCMTVKGYIQENLPDYYLGDGMRTPPPVPNIVYVGAEGRPK